MRIAVPPEGEDLALKTLKNCDFGSVPQYTGSAECCQEDIRKWHISCLLEAVAL
jgi:hypothetical protein